MEGHSLGVVKGWGLIRSGKERAEPMKRQGDVRLGVGPTSGPCGDQHSAAWAQKCL